MHNIRNINSHKRDKALKHGQAFICRLCNRYLSTKLYVTDHDMCTKCHDDISANFGIVSLAYKIPDYSDTAPWKLDIGVT